MPVNVHAGNQRLCKGQSRRTAQITPSSAQVEDELDRVSLFCGKRQRVFNHVQGKRVKGQDMALRLLYEGRSIMVPLLIRRNT